MLFLCCFIHNRITDSYNNKRGLWNKDVLGGSLSKINKLGKYVYSGFNIMQYRMC